MKQPESVQEAMWQQRGSADYEPAGYYRVTSEQRMEIMTLCENRPEWQALFHSILANTWADGKPLDMAREDALGEVWKRWEDHKWQVNKEARRRAGCVHP